MRSRDNLRLLAETACDPVRFARRVLRDDPWSVQEQILWSVANHSQTAVKACHSSGKTRVAAAAVLWWIARFADGIAITTAPTWEQVEKLIWGEIHRAVRRSSFEWPAMSQTELRLGPNNYAIGLSTNRGINFQGFHSGHLLLVIDEAPGVEAHIWEGIEGARASGRVHLLALGNPIHIGGRFYEAFTSEREFWRTFTIDAFDTPNFAGFTLDDLRSLSAGLGESASEFQSLPRPYLISPRWVYEKFWTWSENSPLWQARVRGQFPTQAEDALFSLAWLENARNRAVSNGHGTLQVGIDVAGPGEDETVVTIRCGHSIIVQRAWPAQDPRGEVAAFLAAYRERIDEVNIDSAGIGHYFATHFDDLGYNVNFVNVGEAARDSNQFVNLKAELYWGLRQRFEAGDVAGLTDDRALSQLSSIRYKHNPRGQVVIESKEELRKRGIKSPDRAESIMLAFADRTPGILRYYEGLNRKIAAAENGGSLDSRVPQIDQPDDDAEDMMREYERKLNQFQAAARGELNCAAYGDPLGPQKKSGSDGRYYHPGCPE